MGIYWTKKKFLSILLWNMVWVCIYNFIAHRLWKIFWKRKADIICPYFKLKPNTSALWNGHMIYRPKNVFSALLLLAKCTWVASKFLILIFNKMFETFHALTKVFDKNQLMLFFIQTSLRKALHKWRCRITTFVAGVCRIMTRQQWEVRLTHIWQYYDLILDNILLDVRLS